MNEFKQGAIFNKELTMKVFVIVMLCAMAFGCNQSGSTGPGDKSSKNQPAATAEPASRTNTGVNVRDRDSRAVTPTDQSENTADVKITADIRKRVVDSDMSVNARNTKIITSGGKVTLRGPVDTQQEKQSIESIAKDVAGADNVDSQLEVK